MPVAKFIAILLLRAGPQDIPYSVKLSTRIVLLYLITAYLTLLSAEQDNIVGMILLDVSLLLGFSYLLLASLDLKPRFAQTVAALAGTGMIFNLLSWPLYMQHDAGDSTKTAATLIETVVYILISWNVLVIAHIFRNALETGMLYAILLSFGLLFLYLALARFFFPETS